MERPVDQRAAKGPTSNASPAQLTFVTIKGRIHHQHDPSLRSLFNGGDHSSDSRVGVDGHEVR
jgi:hypothetical protein